MSKVKVELIENERYKGKNLVKGTVLDVEPNVAKVWIDSKKAVTKKAESRKVEIPEKPEKMETPEKAGRK